MDGVEGPGGWECIGWISVDGGTAAFGDAAALPADAGVPSAAGITRGPVSDLTVAGVPLVTCPTGSDADLPVEVLRYDGAIVAARLCFTDDVDELDKRHKGAGSR